MPAKKKKRGRPSSRSSKVSDPEILPITKPDASKSKDSNGVSDKVLSDVDGIQESTSEQVRTQGGPHPSDASVVVMQCASCRTILGDTSGFLEANKRAGTISCSAVRNISLARDIETTSSGVYASCTYRNMACNHCDEIVGQKFVSTTTKFDSIRGAFTFEKAKLFTYELGSIHHNAGQTSSAHLPSGGEGSSEPSGSAMRSLEELLTSMTESMNELWGKMTAVEKENIELRRNFLALERKLQVDDDTRMV